MPITEKRAEELKLAFMTEHNTDNHGTAFTVSVDAVEGTTTGISTGDRLKTIKDLVNPSKKAKDFRRPGHMFPLVAKNGGVIERKGHTEAAVDLPTAQRRQSPHRRAHRHAKQNPRQLGRDDFRKRFGTFRPTKRTRIRVIQHGL